jgi:hypothetical protein
MYSEDSDATDVRYVSDCERHGSLNNGTIVFTQTRSVVRIIAVAMVITDPNRLPLISV